MIKPLVNEEKKVSLKHLYDETDFKSMIIFNY